MAAESAIRNIWSQIRYDPANPDQHFHNLLNRMDAHKDIRTHSTQAYNTEFNASLDRIIPPAIPGESAFTSSGHLKALEHRIIPVDPDKTDNTWGTTKPIRLKILRRLKNIGIKSFPAELSCYTKAFVDAAFNINDWLEDQTDSSIVLTPSDTLGSTIDPGGRAPGTSVPPIGTQMTINLTQFGFPGCEFTGVWVDADNANIQITTPQFILQMIINKRGDCSSVKFTSTGGVNYGYPDNANIFVKGNTVKHNFFSDLTLGGNYRDQWAMAYILCKELGDTIQVILIWMLLTTAQTGFTAENTVVFTPDIPFACRCISLNVPCILLSDATKAEQTEAGAFGGKATVVWLFPGTTNPALIKENINKQRVKAAIAQNLSVKIRFNKYILDRATQHAEKHSEEFKTFVNDYIDKLNTLLSAMNCILDNADVNKVCCKLSCIDIFNSRGPSSTITSIIPYWTDVTEVQRCIHDYNANGVAARDADITHIQRNLYFKDMIGASTKISFAECLQRKTQRGGGNNKKKYLGGSFDTLRTDEAAQDLCNIMFSMLDYASVDNLDEETIYAICSDIYTIYLNPDSDISLENFYGVYTVKQIEKGVIATATSIFRSQESSITKSTTYDNNKHLKEKLQKINNDKRRINLKKGYNEDMIQRAKSRAKSLRNVEIAMSRTKANREADIHKRRMATVVKHQAQTEYDNRVQAKKDEDEQKIVIQMKLLSAIQKSLGISGNIEHLQQTAVELQEFTSNLQQQMDKSVVWSEVGVFRYPSNVFIEKSWEDTPGYDTPDSVSRYLYDTILNWVRETAPQRQIQAPAPPVSVFGSFPTTSGFSSPSWFSSPGLTADERSAVNPLGQQRLVEAYGGSKTRNKNTHNKKLKNTHKLNKKLNKKTRKGKKTHRKTYKKK
jgi:hypothetical protein